MAGRDNHTKVPADPRGRTPLAKTADPAFARRGGVYTCAVTRDRRPWPGPASQGTPHAPVRIAEERPAAHTESEEPPKSGLFSPFTITAFRIIWIANLFANLGTWAQSVAAAWVVTEAHASPPTVAMIQVAAALPLVLLSIMSGVLADNHDRRKIMMAGLAFEMSGATFLTAMAFFGYLDPLLLIVSILWISIGGSITIPAWQAAVNEQVPAKMVGDAVLLNSVNYNVARRRPGHRRADAQRGGAGLGLSVQLPVLPGADLGHLALAPELPVRSLPPERLMEGVVAALRFTQYSSVTRLVMLRLFSFGISASAVGAAALLAHRNPDGDAAVYGYMLGALGVGRSSAAWG